MIIIISYMEPVLQTQARLTSGNGPLPLPERHYIALMVSCSSSLFLFVFGIDIGVGISTNLLPQGSSITGCESLERLQVRSRCVTIPHTIHPSPSPSSTIIFHPSSQFTIHQPLTFPHHKDSFITNHHSPPPTHHQHQSHLHQSGADIHSCWRRQSLVGRTGKSHKEEKDKIKQDKDKDTHKLLKYIFLPKKVPARLRRLEPVNAVLAHRPSSLSPAHIKVSYFHWEEEEKQYLPLFFCMLPLPSYHYVSLSFKVFTRHLW